MKNLSFASKCGRLAAWLALCFFCCQMASANIPGGGTGVGPAVTLTDLGSTVVLDNGTMKAIINKAAATVTSMLYKGLQTVGPGKIYFSMDGGTSYQNPGNCVFTVAVNTPNTVDVSCKHFYAPGDPHALDIDIHYVLRRGASGVYVYAVLNHPASYPATGMGEWRMVWQLPYDKINYTFENIYVDALRHGPAPSYFDFTKSTTQGIKEISLINTGPQAGTFFCKYQFAADYTEIGTWGHASNVHNAGVWIVIGSDEFLNDGPTKQDLSLAQGYTLIHFGRNHYGGSSTTVADGEAWSKTYGPYLMYCNTQPDGADACWTDAKQQVIAEKAAWPYSWLTTAADYPSVAQRGSVTGTFVVSDTLRPAQTAAGAWVGVSQPDPGGNWQNESKRYQYWTKAAADGSFTIPGVRPGTYVFSAFVNGEVDEYTSSATVTAGAATDMGTVTWNIQHPGRSIAWEIGYPDRTSEEFAHGHTDYFYPYLFTQFYKQFPNPIDFTIGVSNPATDWNYAQSALELADGSTTAWPWHIHFYLPALPATGNATLTIAYASNDHAHMYLYVNDDANRFKDIGSPPNGGGNSLLREGSHAKYGLQYVTIPIAKLHQGINTITLLQASAGYVGNHVMYDYINLEMPYPAVTILPSAVTRLVFVRAPSPVQTQDARLTPAVTVRALDAAGDVVPYAPITLSLAPSSTGTGALGGTLVHATSTAGVALFDDMQITQPGSYALRAKSNGITADSSPLFVVNPAPVDTLTFTRPPTDTAAGLTINGAPGVVVQARDAAGSSVPGVSITMGLAVGAGPLGGMLTQSTDVNGNAIFSTLHIETLGTKAMRAVTGTLSLQSAPFVITPGPATRLTVSAPALAYAGDSFTVTVSAVDAGGNVDTHFAHSVKITSSDGQAALPPNAPLFGGTGQFTVTLKTSGAQTVSATDMSAPAVQGISEAIAVNAGMSGHIAFVRQPVTTPVGAALAPVPDVRVTDTFGNGVTGAKVTLTLAAGTGTLSGPIIAWTGTNGIASFPGLSISSAGQKTLGAAALASLTSSSAPFLVTTGGTLTVHGVDVNAARGVSFTAPVATITASASKPASDFAVSVDWGDGTTPAPGTVTGSGGAYTVAGTHTYAASGSSPVTVSVTDTQAGGISAQATATAKVSASLTGHPILHTFSPGLQMLSVTESYASPADGLSDSSHRMVTWSPGALQYETRTAMQPGGGLWVRFSQSTHLYDTGTPAPTNAPFALALHPGWNIIGGPFKSAVSLANVKVRDVINTEGTFRQASEGGVLYGTLYTFPAGATAYQTVRQDGTLTPYQGYWIYAWRACTLLIPKP